MPESIQKENAWETQTYVHFCDGQAVALTLKPEHRVEDVLSLACKVLIFHAQFHLVNSCGLEKECGVSVAGQIGKAVIRLSLYIIMQ